MKPGGRFYLVTRQPHEVAEIVEDKFGRFDVVVRGGYTIFTAQSPPLAPVLRERGRG